MAEPLDSMNRLVSFYPLLRCYFSYTFPLGHSTPIYMLQFSSGMKFQLRTADSTLARLYISPLSSGMERTMYNSDEFCEAFTCGGTCCL